MPAAPVLFIWLTVFLDAMGISLIFPVMPDLLTGVTGKPLGEAAVWGGVLTTAFALMQFIFGPLVGTLSDCYGRRVILLLSMAVMVVDYVLMALAHTIGLLLIGRVIAGIASATYSTAIASITDMAPPEKRAAYFGHLAAAFSLGLMLGPVVSSALYHIDLRAPFWAAAAFSAGSFVFGLFFLPESLPAPARRRFTLREANPFAAFAFIKDFPALKPLLMVFFLYCVTFNVWPTIWSFYSKAAFEWNATLIGLSLTVSSIFTALGQAFLVHPAINRYGENRAALIGLWFEVLTYILYAFILSGFLAFAIMPIMLFSALTDPALQSIMSRHVPENRQGQLQGIRNALMALSMIITPLIMTQTFVFFTRPAAPIFWPGAPFFISAVLMMIGIIIFVRHIKRTSP